MKKHAATIAVCVITFGASLALAQVNTASLTGLVKDPTDAVLVDAKVTARNMATNIERAVQTNSSGYYFLANLPIGTYDVSVEMPGFQKAVANVTLDAA